MIAIIAGDTPRYTTRCGVGRHQYQVTASQGNVGCQGSAFIAAFLFFNLDDDFLTFANCIAYGYFATFFGCILRIAAWTNFLEWKKTVSCGAKLNKAGFQ